MISWSRALPGSVLRWGRSADAWLVATIAIGFGLRVLWAFHVQGSLLFGDGAWFTNVAANLVHGHGFVANHNNPILEPPDVPQLTAYHPPLYPVALAVWWKVFGIGGTSMELLNVFLGTMAIPLVYVLGTRAFGRQVGVASAATYALVPNAIVWLPLPLSEALFTAIFLAALCVLVSFDTKRALLPATLAFGALAGLAALTRGEGVVLLPSALVFWVLRYGWRPSFNRFVFAAAAAVLVITPWMVRNWVQLESPIPIASSTGVNLRISHSPESTGTFVFLNDPIDGVSGQSAQFRTETEVRANRVYTKRAVVYAIQHPGRELKLAAWKVRYLFQSEDAMAQEFVLYGGTGIHPTALDAAFAPLIAISWYTLLAASILLAPLWLRANPRAALPAAVFVFWVGFHIVFFSLPRFHLPLLPLAVIATAAGVAALREKLRLTGDLATVRSG